MKKIAKFFSILLLAVLIIPYSVGAAEPVEVEMTVRNHTGGEVSLKLVDASGLPIFMFYLPGVFQEFLPEGKYDYYASTPCGNVAGVLNLNVAKTLYFGCDGQPEVQLEKLCQHRHWFNFSLSSLFVGRRSYLCGELFPQPPG